jgi:hypothetical protein
MKQEFRQIYHVKTNSGYEMRPFQPIIRLHPEDAAIRNNHFGETNVRYVPKDSYEKYLANARLLN